MENASLSGALREIEEIEREKGIKVFTSDEYKQLRQIIGRRNYWCHCCYYDMAFDLKTGGPAKVKDVQLLFEDLRTAELWRERLFQRKFDLMKKKQEI